MSGAPKTETLTRRERQIMGVLYRLGSGTAAEIREGLTQPPSYTAVRTHLTVLEERGHVTHRSDGVRYVYTPIVPRDEMAKTALDGLLETFFDNSVERAVATLVSRTDSRLSAEQLDRLAEIIEDARRSDE